AGHVSSSFVLPSSQFSTSLMMPSPHTSRRHAWSQPSPVVRLSSSQYSPASTRPFPQLRIGWMLATNPSTSAAKASVSVSSMATPVEQSLGSLSCSFRKQPFSGNAPPSNLPFTLVRHASSNGCPGHVPVPRPVQQLYGAPAALHSELAGSGLPALLA